MKNQKLIIYALSISLLMSNASMINTNNKNQTSPNPYNLEVFIKEEEKLKQLKKHN